MGKSRKSTVPKTHRPRAEESPPEQISLGRGVVEEQSVPDIATAEEKRAFMLAVVAGFADLEVGREHPLAKAKARLNLT
jgi:hypothetical protein